ncbi:MAG: IS982 family transposase [Candidatus Saccharimonadales bacterium]
MRVLRQHHLIPLFVMVGERLPVPQIHRGRKAILRDSEAITILAFNLLTCQQQTLRQVYDWISQYHTSDFPILPTYQNFVKHCHRIIPTLAHVLDGLLIHEAELRFMDSTMLEVCRLVRMRWHRVARGYAKKGYNHQGEHYGFKLHAGIDNDGRLCAYVFSDAVDHDSRALPYLVNRHTKVAVGDTGYRSALHKKIHRAWGTIFVVPPHYKQRRQIATQSQMKLLKRRPKIEAVFDYLKEHLHLQTSFPRSMQGYALHYLRILLG